MKTLPDLHLGKEIELNLYQYVDYRDLLRDYFEACAHINKRYSLRHFSKRLGSQSSGYIQFVLKGKRHLSERALSCVIDMMGLKADEQDYLELLIKLKKSENDLDRYKQCHERLQLIRTKKLHFKTVEESQCEALTSWLHLVIREMVLMKGASLNVQWFKKCLSTTMNVSTKDVLQCIQDLKDANLITEQEDGTLEAADPVIDFLDKRMPALLKLYHQEVMEQAIEGLANPSSQREYGAIISATTEEKFQRFKEKLSRDRREALALLDTPPNESEMVVSFSFQLFPVAKQPKES